MYKNKKMRARTLNVPEKFEEHFFTLKAVSGGKRYFCAKCFKYSNRVMKSKAGNNWTTVGFKHTKKYLVRAAMKVHLESKHHKISCDLEKDESIAAQKKKDLINLIFL